MSDQLRRALLVIDVQQALFEKPTPVYRAADLLQTINTLVHQARAAAAPVITIQHANKSFLAKGSVGWQLHTALEPGDLIIHKVHGSAFQDTLLHQELTARGITSVVVTGLVSEGCVQATCLAAHKHGYHVVLVQDGHSSYHKQAAIRVDEWNQKLAAN